MTISVEPFVALLRRRFPASTVDAVAPMAGGMSSRRFFRAQLTSPGADAPASVVGVFTPDAHKSDEVSRDAASLERDWPFLEVHRLLAEAQVRVPDVYDVDRASGWMALEDLGELTLAEALVTYPEHRTALYQVAVRDLARAHSALSVIPETSVVGTRRFDHALLLWEIEHFREYALLARNIVPSSEQARRYTELAHNLAEYVAGLPTGFVHRDYQSRNLMWLPRDNRDDLSTLPPSALPLSSLCGELVWIDFQDALIGPRVYDLVALLNDSYQTFTREFVEARLTEYAELRNLPGLTPKQVITEFDAVTVQRKLKDAGRFVYFHVKNGDPSYLKFVEPTIAKVKASLKRLDADLFRQWATLLAELLPDSPTH